MSRPRNLIPAEDALAEAVRRFAEAEYSMSGFGCEGMTCTEAEILADILRAGGYPEAAEALLDSHSEGDDDEDDEHHGRVS